jgi:two-component system, NarL family, nitrate/nitrite response regulator NarL
VPSTVREAPPRAIGLVLAGHHPLTLFGLSQVFERESDCSVLATCTGSEAALEAVRRHAPQILVLDVDLPRNGAFTVLRRIQREGLSTRVVLLATTSDDNQVDDAVRRLGARAVVLKDMPPEAFVACVRKVHAGEQWLEGPAVGRPVSKLFKSGTSIQHIARRLTPREVEIARLAVLGTPTRDIAVRLAVKHGTVKIHLHNIYDKLNVGGRLGLMLFARQHGLI